MRKANATKIARDQVRHAMCLCVRLAGEHAQRAWQISCEVNMWATQREAKAPSPTHVRQTMSYGNLSCLSGFRVF